MSTTTWHWFQEHLRPKNYEHFEDPPGSFLSTGSFWTTKILVLIRHEVRVQLPHPFDLHPPCLAWIHAFESYSKILNISSPGSVDLPIQDCIFLQLSHTFGWKIIYSWNLNIFLWIHDHRRFIQLQNCDIYNRIYLNIWRKILECIFSLMWIIFLKPNILLKSMQQALQIGADFSSIRGYKIISILRILLDHSSPLEAFRPPKVWF